MSQFTWKQVDPTAPKKPRVSRRPNQAVSGSNLDATHGTTLLPSIPVHQVLKDQPDVVLTQGIGDNFLSSAERHPSKPFVLEDPFLRTPLPADLQESAGTNDGGESHASIHGQIRIGDDSESIVDAVPPHTTVCLEGCTITCPALLEEENNSNETITLPEPTDHPGDIDTQSARETETQSYPQISPAPIAQIETTLVADIQSDRLFSPAAPPEVYQDAIVLVTAPAAADHPPSPLALNTQEPKSHVGTGHTLKRSSTSVNDTHCRKKRLMSEMRPVVTHQGDDCWDDDIPELFDQLDTMTNLSKVKLLLSILEGFLGSSIGETSLSFNALPRCVRAEIWIRLLVGLGDEDELAGESPRVPQWFSTELLKGRSAKEATWKRLRGEISL